MMTRYPLESFQHFGERLREYIREDRLSIEDATEIYESEELNDHKFWEKYNGIRKLLGR